jgi:hypothetical protein
VSSAKFAAITASLLARKGDAAPSVVMPVKARSRPALVPRHVPPLSSEPPHQDMAEKPRRVMVSITQEELERLNIAAIKKGTSRHDIVRGALNDYFRKLSAEMPHPCACIERSSAVPPRHAQSEARAVHPTYPVGVEETDSAILTDEDRRETDRDVMAL